MSILLTPQLEQRLTTPLADLPLPNQDLLPLRTCNMLDNAGVFTLADLLECCLQVPQSLAVSPGCRCGRKHLLAIGGMGVSTLAKISSAMALLGFPRQQDYAWNLYALRWLAGCGHVASRPLHFPENGAAAEMRRCPHEIWQPSQSRTSMAGFPACLLRTEGCGCGAMRYVISGPEAALVSLFRECGTPPEGFVLPDE